MPGTMVRALRLTVSALVVAGALAGCGGGANGAQVASAQGGKPGASSSAGAPGGGTYPAYARCLREHGLNVKDPDPDAGKTSDNPLIAMADGSDVPWDNPAFAECESAQPVEEAPPVRVSADDLKKLRAFAACVREHGVPEYPDPDPVTGSWPADAPAAQIKGDPHRGEAEKVCAPFAPQTGAGG